MNMPKLLQVFIIVFVLFSTSCASRILHLKEQSQLYAELKHDRLLLQKFRQCSLRPYGEPAAAAEAEAMPESVSPPPSAVPVDAVMNKNPTIKNDEDASSLLGLIRDMADPDRDEIDFTPHLNRLKRIVELGQRLHNRIRLDEDKLSRQGSQFERLLIAYNRAYFGNIQFKVDSPARDAVKGVIKTTSTGFVDRNGNAFIFPGLSAALEVGPGRTIYLQSGFADSKRISSDLVRIFLEALFDSAFRTPAELKATAVQVEWGPSLSPYPIIDGDKLPIPLQSFERVSRDSLRVEAAVMSTVGRAIRGAGVFGINNETLASAVETAAGVIAKKLVEHETFCYFLVTQKANAPKAQTSPISSRHSAESSGGN
jgi:hypothetical protein